MASVLGPSNSPLAEVDHQLTSSSVLQKDRMSPSNGFNPRFTNSSTVPQKVEETFENVQRKHDAEYPTSVESYMWDLMDDQSVFSSSAADSDDKLFVSSMKKPLPLSQTDTSEILNDGEQAKQQEAFPGQHHRNQTLSVGQDSVYKARHLTGLEQEHVKKTWSSSQPEQG